MNVTVCFSVFDWNCNYTPYLPVQWVHHVDRVNIYSHTRTHAHANTRSETGSKRELCNMRVSERHACVIKPSCLGVVAPRNDNWNRFLGLNVLSWLTVWLILNAGRLCQVRGSQRNNEVLIRSVLLPSTSAVSCKRVSRGAVVDHRRSVARCSSCLVFLMVNVWFFF